MMEKTVVLPIKNTSQLKKNDSEKNNKLLIDKIRNQYREKKLI